MKAREWVAILLAIGIATALNLITLAILIAAIFRKSDVNGGISENATQVLTGWGGGMIGVLGAYVGYKAATKGGTDALYGAQGQGPETVEDSEPADRQTGG